MKNLSKADMAELTKLSNDATEARQALVDKIAEFNDRVETLFDELIQPTLDDLNSSLESLQEAVSQKHDDMQSYHDDRSEAWQEGDAGSNYSAWMDQFEEMVSNLDAIELDKPEALEMPDIEIPEEFPENPNG